MQQKCSEGEKTDRYGELFDKKSCLVSKQVRCCQPLKIERRQILLLSEQYVLNSWELSASFAVHPHIHVGLY